MTTRRLGEGQHSELADEGVSEQLEIVWSHLDEAEDPASSRRHPRRAAGLEHPLSRREGDVERHLVGEGRMAGDGELGAANGELETSAERRASLRLHEPVEVQEEARPPTTTA